MRSEFAVSSIILGLFLACTTAANSSVVRQTTDYARSRHPVHQRYYIRHRTKMEHTKIIGGTALKGASVGGLVAGPPGSAVGAAAGAAVGTTYDLKTRKVKVNAKRRRRHVR